MAPRSRLIPFAAVLLLALPAAADPLLTADFEGLPLDQPVPLGGPLVGQPVEVSDCTAIVRDGPLDGACLEIADNDDYMAGIVDFEFLDAGTYGVWWNDAPVITDRAHGVTGRGIGSVSFGPGHDENLAGTFWLDDLRVTPDVSTGITGTVAATWSQVKRDFR